MFAGALRARLEVLEDEILRLSKQASQSRSTAEQDDYLRLAQDLQHEARDLRSEIAKMPESAVSR